MWAGGNRMGRRHRVGAVVTSCALVATGVAAASVSVTADWAWAAEHACVDGGWMDPRATPGNRARRLVRDMTLEQKIGQLHGQPSASDFRRVPGIPELCVPDLTVTNGPAGVGPSITPDRGVPATAMPAPVTLAATWDPRLAGAFGDTVGAEMRETGRNLLEAPDVDLARVPLNGRTFEAFGEDPYLASRIAVPEIRAVQRRGVIAMVKHYVAKSRWTRAASRTGTATVTVGS